MFVANRVKEIKYLEEKFAHVISTDNPAHADMAMREKSFEELSSSIGGMGPFD